MGVVTCHCIFTRCMTQIKSQLFPLPRCMLASPFTLTDLACVSFLILLIWGEGDSPPMLDSSLCPYSWHRLLEEAPQAKDLAAEDSAGLTRLFRSELPLSVCPVSPAGPHHPFQNDACLWAQTPNSGLLILL